jgi:catalase
LVQHSSLPSRKTDNFSPAGLLYRSLTTPQQDNLIGNLASDLGKVRNVEVKHIMLSHFYKADEIHCPRITAEVNGEMKLVQGYAAKSAN